MGFYGNITNTSRTTFQFDKIYSSRYEMDRACSIDGIYIGRYVLVEYDQQASNQELSRNWYLITDQQNRHIAYPSVSLNAEDDFIYFEDANFDLALPVEDLDDLDAKVLYFAENYHITLLNSNRLYIKMMRDGSYQLVNITEFANAYGLEEEALNYNLSQTHEAYIANGVAKLKNGEEFAENENIVYAYVEPNHQYRLNESGQYWTIISNSTFTKDGKTFYQLAEIGSSETDNYLYNFNLDLRIYSSSRGYDSTVWQKVYSGGVEKYVMIAELNTVIPSFGVSADPPSLVPITPHFGADSTNVYYELHQQPSWGFRVKAADNTIHMPKIRPNGQLALFSETDITSQIRDDSSDNVEELSRDLNIDNKYYPSDQKVQWIHTFENNTLFQDSNRKILGFNETSKKWDAELTQSFVGAAIYFNKKGFDSSKIFYSSDLISDQSKESFPAWNHYNEKIKNSGWINEDNISITPSGRSGNVYHKHDGSVDLKQGVDTQELSIMLPSIGDTMAEIWDLVYGGRNTSEAIRKYGKRNKDIFWEDAKGELSKKGLRLAGPFGDEYNREQVETLAGSINTAHDLIGMIISSNTESETEDPNQLDEDRIYYITFDDNSKTGYYRKHKTYTYDTVEPNQYIYIKQSRNSLSAEKIDTGMYYILVNGEYVVATTYNSNTDYYIRQIKNYFVPVPNQNNLKSFPYTSGGREYKWYQDYLGENSRIFQNLNIDNRALFSDYILDPEYHEGKDYYSVTVSDKITFNSDSNYEPGKFWYYDDNYIDPETGERKIHFQVDYNEEKTDGRRYFLFDKSKLVNIKENSPFKGVYVPGTYYYKEQTADGEQYKLDLSPSPTPQRTYYLLNQRERQGADGAMHLYKIIKIYTQVNLTAETFIQNFYYLRTGTGTNVTYVKDSGEFSSTKNYYLEEITYVEAKESFQVEELATFAPGVLCAYQLWTFFTKVGLITDPNNFSLLELTRTDFVKKIDTFFNQDIFVFQRKDNGNPPFLDLITVATNSYNEELEEMNENNPLLPQETFYQKNTYHYKKNGSYILDTSSELDPNKEYYTITSVQKTPSNIQYYYPNKYYIESDENEDHYILSEDLEKPSGKTLYEKVEYYVKSDSNGILYKGMKWNPYALAVPSNIELGIRREVWEKIKIPTYSQKEGTLNGMILKMYQTIEPNDSLTRDDGTVNGAINKLKDIIARFDIMKSRELLLVDDYGRVHSSPIATLQTAYNNDILSTVNSVSQMENRWITVDIDGDPLNPLISIHHNFQPVENTASSSDINGDSQAQIPATDTIDLYTPIVDVMGHVVGKNTETVTLPYGFKTISINGISNNVSNLTGTTNTSINAGNTQDTFTIDTQNKWINIQLNTSNKNISFAHFVGTITDTDKNQTDLNNITVDATDPEHIEYIYSNKITLQDIIHDEAGHITACQNHEYTLPYGFKVFKHSNNFGGVGDLSFIENYSGTDIIASNVVDSFSFASQNKWIRLQADGKTLKLAHLVNNFTATTSTGSLSSESSGATFTTISIERDEAGHLTGLDTKTLTMPNSFGKIALSAASTNNTTELTSNATGFEANCTYDTLTFAAGDRWIHLAGDSNNDKIIIGHASPDNTVTGFEAGNQTTATLNYNGSFNIPHIQADNFGHIHTVEDISFTLPSIGLTSPTTSNGTVVTGIGLIIDNSEASFSYTVTEIGSLILNNWNYDETNQSAGVIANTDSIIGAFSKLQKRIKNEEDNRSSAINKLNPVNTTSVSDDPNASQLGFGQGNTITSLILNTTENSPNKGTLEYQIAPISISLSQINNLSLGLVPGELHLLTAETTESNTVEYSTEELSWNHISSLLPLSGEEGALLTEEAAASTYLTKNTKFIWQEADPEQEIEEETKTIDELIKEIKYLKAWVNYLKDPNPNNLPEIDDPDDSPDPENQGTNPDPDPNDPGEGGNEQNP